mgnify:CR=1 FL=1
MDDFTKYWAPFSGIVSLGALIVMALLGKTFAKKESVTRLQNDVDSMKEQLKNLPTKDELHKLHLDIANLRGDIQGISPQLSQVKKMSDLLLENELNKEKV